MHEQDAIKIMGSVIYWYLPMGIFKPVREEEKSIVKCSIGQAKYRNDAAWLCRCGMNKFLIISAEGSVKARCDSCGWEIGLERLLNANRVEP